MLAALKLLSEFDQDLRYTFAHVGIRDKEIRLSCLRPIILITLLTLQQRAHVDRSVKIQIAFADI